MHLDKYEHRKRKRKVVLPQGKDIVNITNIKLVGYANEYLVALSRYFINPITKQYGNESAALQYCVEYCRVYEVDLDDVWLEYSPSRLKNDRLIMDKADRHNSDKDEARFMRQLAGEALRKIRAGEEDTEQIIKLRQLRLNKAMKKYVDEYSDVRYHVMFKGNRTYVVTACVMWVIMEILDNVNPDFSFERRSDDSE